MLLNPFPTRFTARLAAGLLAALASLAAGAQTLPPEVDALLARAKVPREAFAAVVVDAAPAINGKTAPLLSWRAGSAMNPASVMKLVTTYAGLELLGPAYTWTTPVYADGPIANGVLSGNLIIQGRGDPKLVMERLWLLLRRVQGLGIKTITGDIVLDRSAFAASTQNPGDFDGEALRPYNVQPDALLLNYKSVVMTFAPNPGSGSASISYDPPLAGVQMQASVPLSAGSNGRATLAECGDYRAQLQPDFADPLRMAFAGSYPAACGEKVWAIAYPDPASYAQRAIAGLWQEMGGTLGGRVQGWRGPARLGAGVRDGIAVAGRNHPRHQQVQQQRDGAAAVPDAQPAAPRRRQQRGFARGGARLVAGPFWCAERRARYAGAGQRLGPVAPGAHHAAGPGAHAADRVCVGRHARADGLAADQRRRWHLEAQQVAGLAGLGAPEIGHPARRHRAGRLRAHAQRPAPGGGRHRQPRQRAGGAAGARSAGGLGREGRQPVNLTDLIGSLALHDPDHASFVPQAWLSFSPRASGDPQPNSAPEQAWGTIHACPLSVSNTGNG